MTVRQLRERAREDLLQLFKEQHTEGQIREELDKICNSLIPEGTEGALRFSGVNYACQNRSDWGLAHHYRPLLFLAHASQLTNGEESQRLLRICHGLLLDWVNTAYKCPNWWFNVIDMPTYMSKILLLVGEKLPRELFERAMEVIRPGSIADDPSIEMAHSGGANFLWIASLTINQCLLRESEELLSYTVERIKCRTLVYDVAGFQRDGSFFQHGKRLYSCGYGASFVVSIADIVYTLRDTPYQLPSDGLSLVSAHILDGIRYMSHRGFSDYAAMGREYVRPNASSLKRLLPSLRRLGASSDMPRHQEINAFADEIANEIPAELGVKYFPIAKHLSTRVSGIYIAFRGADDESVDAEIINRENPLGYNLSYGTHTTVMQRGDEYTNLAPLWDYTKIPGTTAYYETDEELLAREDFTWRTLPLRYFGGVQEGNVGICYLKTEHEGTRATVSAFATPYGMAILGCALENDEGKTLVTTVEQSLLVAEAKKIGDTVLHGKVAYRPLDKNISLSYFTEHRSGSFRRQRETGADIRTENDVLTVLVERDAAYDQYAYLITEESLSEADFEVLRNDKDVQAVRIPDGRILAVFYKDANLIIDGNLYHGEENTAKIF